MCALGEVGLDYSGCHRKHSKAQKATLRQLLTTAREANKPVIIHCRDADDDCFEIVSDCLPRYWKIHLHCFTRGWQSASKWCSTFPNLYVGLTPLVTWGSQGPGSVAKNIPLERLLLETDAPYFVPRGFPKATLVSNPTMAIHVAYEVAKVRGVVVDEVLLHCLGNTRRMYSVHI